MDSNSSSSSSGSGTLILIAGLLREPAGTRPLVFTVVLLLYAVALVGNLLLCAAIYRDPRLHRPMFILLANLAISDVVGCSATLPRIMRDLAAPNFITVGECVAQMLAIQFYRALECYVLTAMALDRYAAICRPLRYHAVVTNGRVATANAATVVVSALLVSVLLILTSRLNFYNCDRPKAVYAAQCDNVQVSGGVRVSVCPKGNNAFHWHIRAEPASSRNDGESSRVEVASAAHGNTFPLPPAPAQLLNFACSDGTANNVYGLVLTTCTVGLSLAVVSFSYASIIYECRFRGTRRDTAASKGHQKAMQTCVTHVLVLAVFYLPVLFLVTYNRVDKLLPIPDAARQLLGGLFYIAPPALNPIIYGVRTGEIRKAMLRILLCKFGRDSVTPGDEGH
uniref:Olfactory receptor 51I2-like n=1 Tax=Petromyzon marinus TaxID=7757 RepID=A0AAJ7UFU5_PETMA|nr:olfactory receptor 51I2-like [Petromyzon marinus]